LKRSLSKTKGISTLHVALSGTKRQEDSYALQESHRFRNLNCRIALIIKRREASNAAGGDRAWGKFLHSRDVLRTATEPMTAKEIASGVLAAANITDAYQAQRRCTECRRSAWGRRLPNLDIWAGLRA